MLRRIIIGFIIILAIMASKVAYANTDIYNTDEIFENHGSVMLTINATTGEIVGGNNAAEKFYGYSLAELKSMNINQINTLSPDETKTEMGLAASEKRNFFVFKHKLKDETIKDVEVYSSPVINDNGDKILFSIVHDITPRIYAEKEANRSKVMIIALLSILLLTFATTSLYMSKTKRKEKLLKQRYQNLFDNMNEGFALHEIICDMQGVPVDYRFLEVNKSFETITGVSLEQIKNKTVKEVFPGTEKYWIEKYGQVALEQKSLKFTNYSQDLGKYFSVSVYSPKVNQFATIFTDITNEIQAKEKIEFERKLLKITLHSLGDGVISTDNDGKIDLMNAVAENLTGWTNEEAKGETFETVFNIINEFTRVTCESPVKKVFETGEVVELENHTLLINKYGYEIPIEDSAAPIKDEKRNINGVVIVFRDYTDKKEKQDKIQYLSYHDQLTGLYNRHFFEEKLKVLDIEANIPITIAMLDVNGLKLTNDAFGHQMGDKLLKNVASVLKNECRADDIVARVGGDEFVLLLPKTTYEEAEKVVGSIYKSVENTKLDNIVISVSIGCETKAYKEQQMSEVFAKAEEDMYRKKLTESQSMRSRTINVILKALNETNEREKIHSEKVSQISRKIGEAMKLDYDILKEIELAGLMHDIGKIAISKDILNKPGKLDESEYEEIKRHPEIGYHILKSVDEYTKLSDYALSHHERWDGKGYPRGLEGEEIPLIARIITVADAFEAMTAERTYKRAMSNSDAIEELKRCSGKQFDPSIVKICIEHCWTKNIGNKNK